MAIDLQSLSITSAFNSIVNFFKSQENQGKWKDLVTGSEGSFLIRLLANVMSTLSYRIVAQSRENYLSTAALPSSNIGIAVNLGYSVFRGSNFKRRINITPYTSGVFPKLSVIGKYDETYNILTLQDVVLEEGVPIEIDTVVGVVKEEEITAGTSATKVFSLFTSGISEDYKLYLGSTEVPTTKVIKRMTDDKYLVRTNPYSSVDIMYLNSYAGAKYTYGTESVFTLSYVELDDINEVPFEDSMFTYGKLNSSSSISSYLPFEDVDRIKTTAPLDHETQNLIRSKQDYANRINQIIPTIDIANYMPLTPTYTLITYLKNNFTLLTEEERKEIMEILKEENYFGTPLPDITHPRREVANLKISMALNTKYKNISDINLDIDNLLENYYDAQLGSTFNTYDLERKLESLSYVKYARVNHVFNKREPDKNYQAGYVLEYNDQCYIATKILGLSGDRVPNWNLPLTPPSSIDTGLETKDGSIIWRAYKLLPNMPLLDFSARQDNMQYGIGDYVYDPVNAPNYMFKCVDLIKSSGFALSDTSLLEKGSFVTDGNLVWVLKDRSDDYPSWSASTNYRLGDSVNDPNTSAYSLECVSYTGTTGTDEQISFELPVYKVEEQSTNTFTVEGNKTYYFRPGDIISVSHKEGLDSFSVISSSYQDSKTIITVGKTIDSGIDYIDIITTSRGTRDGQVLWDLLEDPSNITYPWNGFVVFEHELEIIGA